MIRFSLCCTCLFYIFLIIDVSKQSEECHRIDDLLNAPGYFELMESPKLHWHNHRQFRIMFDIIRYNGDKVKIYEESPKKKKIFYEASVPSKKYIDTNKKYNEKNKYTAEYVRSNGTVIARSEFKYWSGWMNCIRESLGPRSVGSVLFPGTHDSGSYLHPGGSYSSMPHPSWFLSAFAVSQGETVEEQLERGARYLDLRIAHYSKDGWYINHDKFKMHDLSSVVKQIKSFHSRWPNEIILIDLHRFPVGFKNKEMHDKFAKYMIDTFGSLLYRPKSQSNAWAVTLNEIWSTPARILLSYSEADIASKYNFFPPVNQIWANTDKPDELYKYLNEHTPRSCKLNEMTSVMAELTPQSSKILHDTLRRLADSVNAQITLGFYNGQWGNSAQAVAVDFLSSTGIIPAAIHRNVERSKNKITCT